MIEFLLRHHARTGAEGALQMARDTAERMARGGIYDQLGGGFAQAPSSKVPSSVTPKYRTASSASCSPSTSRSCAGVQT
ncbi:hypothetical protein SHIRM173S_02277 [Streptomyces hirsutus]